MSTEIERQAATEWLPRGRWLRDVADRFVVGSDQLLGEYTERLERARAFVDALPPDPGSASDATMRSASTASRPGPWWQIE